MFQGNCVSLGVFIPITPTAVPTHPIPAMKRNTTRGIRRPHLRSVKINLDERHEHKTRQRVAILYTEIYTAVA